MVPRLPCPILLVDDKPANLLALEAVLQELGERLVRANSGDAALRCLRDEDFAAVLLDVRMPGMDGFETARLIRMQRRSRATPIIFITADTTDLSVEEAYAIGAVDLLAKPLVPAVLKAKVAFFVELHRSRQELQAAERRAVEDRAFLAAVLEAIEDGVVACGADGVLTLFNRATREFHGKSAQAVSPDEWAGRYDLYRADGKTRMPKEEIPLFRAFSGESVRDSEFVIAPKGGKARVVLASGQPLYDQAGRKLGAVVSMHDVSARREAQAASEAAAREQSRRREAEAAADLIRESRERLRASEERVRLATDAAGLGVWVLDVGTGTVTWENERMYALLGLSAQDEPVTATRFAEEFLHSEDAAAFNRAIARTVKTARQLHFEGRFLRHHDRAQRWIELTGILQPESDRSPLRVLGTAADITDRKRSQENLEQLAAELAETDRRKTEFLATLAHELRNPLAPLSNGLQLMRMAADNPTALEKAREMMERQLRHLVHLVDDLLDIARISSGKIDLKKERVALKAVIDGAVESSLPLVSIAGHSLELDIPDQSVELDADPIRLGQVVSNLLNNAAKYTTGGGRIKLSVLREPRAVVISVADSGIGIAHDALPQVFEMFTQVGRGRERSQGGLGIGLALVRRLVELHDGTVTAESAGVGQGSKFMVRLPLASRSEAALPSAAALPEPQPVIPLRVLVVDDNVDAAESLAALLDLAGHATRVAHDGDQALLTAHEFRPEVVFLDIGMPGKDGYEVAKALRGKPETQQVVLVALTGWGAKDDRARSTSAGFDHHLTKPAGLAAVEGLLSKMAGDRPAR
jgi:PAS domain S-box-containing protein